jgi:hypothetical protein
MLTHTASPIPRLKRMCLIFSRSAGLRDHCRFLWQKMGLIAAANIRGTPVLWKPGDVRVEAVILHLWMMASYDLPDLVNTLFRYVHHQ